MKLRESEAWRMIGDAFEARIAEPELVNTDMDVAASGLCNATDRLNATGHISGFRERRMDDKSRAEVAASGGTAFIIPTPWQAGGLELRATLAYLFAEEAAA